MGKSVGKNAQETITVLLPVLDRSDMSGLAYKQTLEAVADTGLDPGTFYPYLGIAPLDFDETLNRLVTEWARRSGNALPPDALPHLLEAFGKGNFTDALRRLADFTTPLHEKTSRPVPALAVLRALAARAQQNGGAAATGAKPVVRPEEVLLAALLLRDGLTQS